MKLDKVFLAFLKSDGEEHLLYRKDNNLYIDLNTKEKISLEDIDLTTLIYFKDSIYCLGDSRSKFNIKKMFKKDRESLIDIERLCIVDIKRAINVKREIINKYKSICSWQAMDISRILLEKNIFMYYDIRNCIVYKSQYSCLDENDIYVETGKDSKVKYLCEIYPCQKTIEKRKVLKLQYDVINNKLI